MKMTAETYAQEMIAHHRDAISMSRKLLEDEEDSAMADFARKVITAQSAEIKQLQRWLEGER